MALSYEFSIGSVRAKENSLFTGSDIEHMLGCKNISELCRYLNDKGYGEGSDIETIIKNNTSELWNYLRSVAPDFKIFAPFIYINDIHNLKAVLKGIMSDRKFKSLILEPYTISPDIVVKAVENRNFSLFPEWLSKPADRAYETLAHTSDARLSDAILDKAVMEKILKISEKLNSQFVFEYFKTTVFYNNIKIAIRASRTGTDRDFLNNAFCDVEDFPRQSITDTALKGIEPLIDLLSKLSAYECSKAVDEYKISPSAFERFVDNKLIIMAKESCKRAGEGAEPLMGYLIGREAEKKIIRIIANGLRTDSGLETIRERLREIYG